MRSAVSLTVLSERWYVIYILLIREMNGVNFVPRVSPTGQVGENPGDEVGLE